MQKAVILMNRLNELDEVEGILDQLITVDFAGPFDDRRGLVALKGWLETRRVNLEVEYGSP